MNVNIPFAKLEGCGNSFVMVAAQDCPANIDWPSAARRWSSPAWGLGTDGVMVLGALPESAGAPRPVSMFNPDGSSGGMCGNGMRCIARFEVLRSLDANSTGEPLVTVGEWRSYIIEGRIIKCCPQEDGRVVTVNMGVPGFSPDVVPTSLDHQLKNHPVTVNGATFLVSAVSMGNPHCVVMEVPESASGSQLRPDSGTSLEGHAAYVKDIAFKYGPSLEVHPLFPKRANVEFVSVVSPQKIVVAVWERGAGYTLACGTGACAAVVAYAQDGKCGEEVQVNLPGGAVSVTLDTASRDVFLKGPVGDIAVGSIGVV